MGLITALFTALYSIRVLQATFLAAANSPRVYATNLHELTGRMAFALTVLCFGSLFVGYLSRDLFVG
jgi:NADH-ubiquinone oxidoreductase chain 5